jgi:hypothetical protein
MCRPLSISLRKFRQGDTIAIIDCMTFVPEQIPVLIRLEILNKLQKPFNDLKLLTFGSDAHLIPRVDSWLVDSDHSGPELQLD